jgi:uncharacterized protein (DUF952 family)
MLAQDSLIHATTREIWEAQAASGAYLPPGFDREGFIHCCHPPQLETVFGKHFGNVEVVMLLVIDAARVTPEIKYERAPSAEDDYPHIYGALDVSAVIDTIDIRRDGPTWTIAPDL